MILKTSRWFWLPAVGLIPFLLTSAVTLSQYLAGGATAEEVSLPFVAMSIMSLSIAVILGLPLMVMAFLERSAIQRLTSGDHWARWPQHADEGKWHDFAASERDRELEANKFSWIPVIVLTVLFVGLAGFVVYLFGPSGGSLVGQIVALVALSVFFAIIMTSVIGRPFLGRRRAMATYNRRISAPIPNVYIGRGGLYDEDKGYSSFSGLNERLVGVEAQDKKPGNLIFQIRHNSRQRGYTSTWIEKLAVRVPDGMEAEAKSIADRLVSEGAVRP